jgi:hypothetical protein
MKISAMILASLAAIVAVIPASALVPCKDLATYKCEQSRLWICYLDGWLRTTTRCTIVTEMPRLS